MNKKIIIAALVILVAGIVLVAAYYVLSDDKEETGEKELRVTEEDLTAFRVTLYDEEAKIDLLNVTTLEGLPFDNDDMPKKYVLFTFWATWCPFCKAENPSIQELYNEHASEKFTVLTISVGETSDVVKGYLEENGFDFPTVLNTPNNLKAEYAPGVPTSYLIDPEGYIIAKMIGSREWNSEEALRILDYLMNM